MADVPFSIAGNEIRCPQFSCEPGALVYAYQNGSQCVIGAPQVSCSWPFLPDDEVAFIWSVYSDMVNSGSVTDLVDSSIEVTVPDFANGGLRAVRAYMTRPAGKAVGDGTQNMQVTFYNLHAASMLNALNSPQSNYWELINNRQTITVGGSEYPSNDWQF